VSWEAQAIACTTPAPARPVAKLVLLGIANHDGDGGAWPSVAPWPNTPCAAARTVQRAVDELERLGEVRRVVQAGGQRWTADHERPNLYEFLLHLPARL
jgi:hypothetical protein